MVKSRRELFALNEVLKVLDPEIRNEEHMLRGALDLASDVLKDQSTSVKEEFVAEDQEAVMEHVRTACEQGITLTKILDLKFLLGVADDRCRGRGFTVSLYECGEDRSVFVQANNYVPNNYLATFAEGAASLWETFEESCQEPKLTTQRQFSRFIGRWFGNLIQLMLALAGMGYVRKVRPIRGRDAKDSEEMGYYKAGFKVIWYEEPPLEDGVVGPIVRFEFEDEEGGLVGVQLATFADEVTVTVTYEGDADAPTVAMIEEEMKFWRVQAHRAADALNRLLSMMR